MMNAKAWKTNLSTYILNILYIITLIFVFISIIFNNESSYKLPTEILAGWRLTIKCQTLPPSDRDIIRLDLGLVYPESRRPWLCSAAGCSELMAHGDCICRWWRSLGAGWRREREGPRHLGESLQWHWPHPVPGSPLWPSGAVRLILYLWHLDIQGLGTESLCLKCD